MLNSNERMGFIIEYMSSYDEKIKMANKNGLFDAAKMFELFAIEVCNVWFGQKFSNLNDETATYPYVDLISENRELLVQVSTVQDVPTKIKTTLEKIRDSKDKKCSDLKNIVFFVLSNNSIDKVREYSGDDQIGSISFTIKDNLITTNDIITKAQNDLNFQKKLYKVLKDEYENFNINIRKFKGALELSNSGLKNIEGLINGEYEIDRNEFLEKITKDNERYISIQGGAGSGKSVLCKKYVENEKLVLYARAERFLEESHIDDIWGCCIQDVLECINGKKLIFFIDALEFIADCAETKFELLQYLYDMAAEYQNVYIVTSCRTSDKNAFIKLETNFSIKIYEVGDITEDELALLMKQYPIIHKMYKTNSYVDLLKSPFYINLIVSNSMDIDNIGDENSLREYIWKNIICLEGKSRMYGILSNKVIETVEKIVFERARKFMLGIHKDDIDRDIMHALLSEGVIAQQGDYIRLKYDIFEDICFEHYFDKAFDLCKGKYKTFYDEIENLGRCVYRRYQIWISNKMFIQVNRDKFLYSLTFSDEIPQSWKRQTEIGIVKSRFCDNYFEEQGSEILEQGMLFDFVKNINLFAFEGELLHIRQESPQMKLSPIGNGRPCIIRLLKNEEIYKKNIIGRDDIVKLCLDYAKQEDKVAVIASDACAMMEYYVEYSLQESEQENYYKIIDEISSCLEALYRMADNSEEWLKKFFNTLINNYINGNRKSMRKSEDIMEWTLKNAYPALVTGLASELCSIADILWLRGKVDAEEFDFYRADRLSNPNMQPKLSGIDRYIKDDNGNCYTSREEEIIDRYLLQEESLEIDVFDMSNYDISTICYVANCGLNFTNESFRMVIHEILLCVIDIWKYTKRNYNAHEIFDVYQEHEIIELFQREMIQTQDDAKMAIDILFEEIDFTKFTTDTIEFYQDIFGNFLCEFFDSYVDSKRRNICKKKILYIEKKVNDIDEEYVRIQLYKSLMLSVTRYCTGDWSKIKTNYSYVDKQFLNKQFTKYGKYHIKELLRTIYQMHMDELLPEILISIRNSFQNAKSEVNKFKKSIREQEAIVQLIILKSFITYSDKIKQDQELIEAYEDILEILINLNYEQAAVILDEFRIH